MVNGWDWNELGAESRPATMTEESGANADGSGCATQRDINDVFFWNNDLAFFVGASGFLCRYGIGMDAQAG